MVHRVEEKKCSHFTQHRHLENILCRLLVENRSSCRDGCVVNAIALRKSRIHSYTITKSASVTSKCCTHHKTNVHTHTHARAMCAVGSRMWSNFGNRVFRQLGLRSLELPTELRLVKRPFQKVAEDVFIWSEGKKRSAKPPSTAL